MTLNQVLQTFGRWLFGLLMGAATLISFLAPDDPKFQAPALARIFFFHFPCAIVTTVFMIAGAVYSVIYLVKKRPLDDVKAQGSQELAVLFGVLTLATGIIFSKVQWGEWWNWDPRQTTFLLALCFLFAYFALRAAHSDEQRRRMNAAVYAASSALPIFFLIFVFPRLPQVARFSLHPNNTITEGLTKGPYGAIVSLTLLLVLTLSIWVFRLRVRAGELEILMEDSLGKLETGGGNPATPRVVRTVSIPDEG